MNVERTNTILIADDESSARATLEALLFGQGYCLCFAVEGEEALQKAAELSPDLILLDVMMPGMDGFEVCRRLRADSLLSEVPVILVTALEDRASRLQGLEAGADDFIGKPFDRLELLARVRTVMRLNRYRRLVEERVRRQEAEGEIRRLYHELQERAARLEETVAQRTRDLRIERDRTRAILEALGEAVVVTDTQGTIQYVNPAAVALTGHAREELLGQSVELWLRGQQPAELTDRVLEAVLAGKTWSGEVANRRSDGTAYDAILTAAPLFDPHDASQTVGFVGVQRDITPLKEAERVKDRFVSNVSHELRTPLSVISLTAGNLDALYGRLDDSRRRKMIRDLREQARALNGLIQNVLEISRIDSGRAAAERQRLDLARLVRDEAEKQLPLIREKGQSLRLVGAERLTVCGNDGQLRQVIRNLLSNAIKYTPNGGQIACESHPQIDGGVAEDDWPGSGALTGGRWAGVRVVDTGVGIQPHDLPHLFERFYRGGLAEETPGTGLGLSIVQELVRLHHGHTGVASEPGKGSVFAIYLPLPEQE